MSKPLINASFIWLIILTVLYVIDCYFQNFLTILYTIISNLVLFGLYLLTIVVLHELNDKKEKE